MAVIGLLLHWARHMQQSTFEVVGGTVPPMGGDPARAAGGTQEDIARYQVIIVGRRCARRLGRWGV